LFISGVVKWLGACRLVQTAIAVLSIQVTSERLSKSCFTRLYWFCVLVCKVSNILNCY